MVITLETNDHKQRTPVLLPVGCALVHRMMREQGLSLADLAHRLGIPAVRLCEILDGHARLSEPLLTSLAEAVGLEPVEIASLIDTGEGRLGPFAPGCMRGTVEIFGDVTEPMGDWDRP